MSGRRFRESEAYRRVVQHPNATPFHGNQEDVTIVRCVGTGFELGDWVCVLSSSSGMPYLSTPGAANSKSAVGVVIGGTSTEYRVQVTGVCAAKVDPALSTGSALGTKSGSTTAQEYDASGDGAICGKLLYYFTDADSLALVQIDTAYSKNDYDRIKIHHHSDDLNTKWVDTTYGTDVGRSWHLFRVFNISSTGENNRLCLNISGGNDGKPASHESEGYVWGGVIGFRDVMSAAKLGGDEDYEQGVIGVETSIATAAGPSRVNFRTFGGWNSRDRNLTNGQVGPIRFQRGDHTPTWPGGSSIAIDVPPPIASNFAWWSGAMIWDSGANCSGELHDGVASDWGGQWAPSIACEINCCDEFNWHTECVPNEECCSDFIDDRTKFVNNGVDLNGSYENVIPWNYTVTAGRIDELSAICCHSRHISNLWYFWDTFTCQLQNWIDALCTFLTTKADSSGQTPGPCMDSVIVPTVDCGPSSSTDCDGNVITPP